ncbi:MAG: antitoxin Xre/MbcA/ParS toxin-binding domain-containing protein [Sphingomonadaceae bacterium]
MADPDVKSMLSPMPKVQEEISADVTTKFNIHAFWQTSGAAHGATDGPPLKQLRLLLARVREAPGVQLFDAMEAGVPTGIIKLIANASGVSAAVIMRLAGISPSTFVRHEVANKPLPDAAGHRMMAYLRLLATLRQLLEESGDPGQMKSFNPEQWMVHWVQERLPELGDKSPADMLRNPEGQRAVEQVLERMRGGLAA